MQSKAKLYLLSLVTIVGLLLGGNVKADGAQLSAAQTQAIAAQIQQTSQQIANLTAQMNQLQGQPAPAAVKVQLTQAQLDTIEIQVKAVHAKYEQLKVQIEVFVAIREIQQKINVLISMMPAATSAAPASGIAAVPAQKPGVPVATSDSAKRQELEVKIATTQRQIAELTQELQNVKADEEQTAAATGQSTKCSGPECGAMTSQTSAVTPSAPVQVKTSQPQASPKGFWQSVASFFKKLFTF